MSGKRYRGNDFTIDQPEGWSGSTVHTLVGPVQDGIQHTILIAVEEDLPFGSVVKYAESRIDSLKDELEGFRVLEKDNLTLRGGHSAVGVGFTWRPADGPQVIQEQLFVLAGTTGYRLTATFSDKTHKILGPNVEKVFKSFRPEGTASE